MIDWVFLDIGNVLLDEDPLTYVVFRRHVEAIRKQRPDLTFVELLADREARAAAGSRWPVWEVASEYLDTESCARVWDTCSEEVSVRFAELSPIVPGVRNLVDQLGSRFRLGLIANQGDAARKHLAANGLLDRFDVVALSELEGLFKPDPALFERAVERAGVGASSCLMVGDRLDNDLAPASSLGMATAWVRWPNREAKGWNPADRDACAYLHSLARSSVQAARHWSHIPPSVAVDDIEALPAAIAAIYG